MLMSTLTSYIDPRPVCTFSVIYFMRSLFLTAHTISDYFFPVKLNGEVLLGYNIGKACFYRFDSEKGKNII